MAEQADMRACGLCDVRGLRDRGGTAARAIMPHSATAAARRVGDSGVPRHGAWRVTGMVLLVYLPQSARNVKNEQKCPRRCLANFFLSFRIPLSLLALPLREMRLEVSDGFNYTDEEPPPPKALLHLLSHPAFLCMGITSIKS